MGDSVLEWSVVLKKQPEGDRNSPSQGQKRQIICGLTIYSDKAIVDLLRFRYALAKPKSC
jgi:hypothetical protein